MRLTVSTTEDPGGKSASELQEGQSTPEGPEGPATQRVRRN